MTISRKIASSIGLILSMFILGGTSNEKKYLKSSNIQIELEQTMTSLLKLKPEPKYIKIYFTESKGKVYVFVTTVLNVYSLKSNYYFELEGKQVVIGFQSKELEEQFANLEYKKAEKIFNYSDEIIDIFDGHQVVYEIINDNTINRIRADEEIGELNDYGQVKFIPPVRKNKE